MWVVGVSGLVALAVPVGAVFVAGAGRAVAASAGGVSGRASAAAQVTPIEVASNPRMPTILDIVIHFCPSVN
ncbi:hypothetical protein Saso_30770 [Streptomyces asoensis]|uniref:Secreted protein n=1 Tax=Streptomyces asoensis TaxID=249586 RepID=A0ABQ3S0B5_9ACTN|nr:hypothetical protein GCM10010496_24100 [Streptomyces asoensis]GHI61427.1 hypothetical protein Saso_30770 [Streptomyces asoensis]